MGLYKLWRLLTDKSLLQGNFNSYYCRDKGTMNITELKIGAELRVSTLIDNMPVTLKTSTISVMDGAMLVGPMKYHGVPIPAATNATAEAVDPETNEKHSFTLESVVPFVNWNDTYYLLRGSEIITTIENQRKAERYVINVLGKAIINHNTTVSAIIYDISIRGLSLLLGKNATAKTGEPIKLFFKPNSYARPFEVNLTVVRNFRIGTYDAVGCKMRGIDSALLSYIMDIKKQKEEIRKAQSESKVLVRDESEGSAKLQ